MACGDGDGGGNAGIEKAQEWRYAIAAFVLPCSTAVERNSLVVITIVPPTGSGTSVCLLPCCDGAHALLPLQQGPMPLESAIALLHY